MGNGESHKGLGCSICRRCCKCKKDLPPCKCSSNPNLLYKDTIHGRHVYVYNGGEYYRPVDQDFMFECEHCFNKPIREQEEIRRREEERRRQEERQRREEERRRQEEQQRREEERIRQEEQQRREEERRRQEEQQRREEERRRQEEQQRREEERRREEEQQRREEERRREEEQQRRREEEREEERRRQEERERREEERRRQEEQQRRETERRRQEEHHRREEERRRQEEHQRRVEERKRQEEQERREEERRRQEELQRMEEDRRRQQELQRREEEMRRQEGRQRREEEKRRQEEQNRGERERRGQEERQRREEDRKSEEERQRRGEERRRNEERQRNEEEKRRKEERQRTEEEKKTQQEQQKREEERRRQEGRQAREEERRRQEETQRREEDRRRQEERERREEGRRIQEEQQMKGKERRRQEEGHRREEERKREEERQRREEERRRQEEQQRKEKERRRQEEGQRREEERRRQEEQQRKEKERRRQEEGHRREEERKREEERQRREEERRRQEEQQRKEKERRRQEEGQRREEERRRQEEGQRREGERRRQEEQQRKEKERRRQEEGQRREEERRRNEEGQRREGERRRQEEQQRREKERRGQDEIQRRKEERRQAEERQGKAADRRGEELNQKLQESNQKAKEQLEKLSGNISEEQASKRDVLIMHLDEFEANYEPGSDGDDLLEILSVKCSNPVRVLNLTQLTADQLGNILSVLDELLFDEWIGAHPSLSTLQHTEVFITELCRLSVEMKYGVSLQNISDHLQFLVESISQSACNVFENFLLTQALYLNLMHFFTDRGSCDTDAVLIARQWTEDELSTEQLFLLDFLGILTSSLESAAGRATVCILEMEIQCLKLLLSTLKHLNGKESYSESTEVLIRLVQASRWTPTEAVTLLKAVSQKYAADSSISKILTLVQVYDISPEWTDESGHSVVQALDFASPERFNQDFLRILRRKDESSVVAALADVKVLWNLDDSVTDMIKSITSGVLQYLENASKDAPLGKGSIKCETLNADNLKNSLLQLCKAVFDTKGLWPTVRQMVRWCAWVLTEKSEALQLVGVEEDPCVSAMFAATQVYMGKKLDIVLSSDIHVEARTKEWSDFYKYLGISVTTNMKATGASYKDVYKADIVYGTMDDFVSDYLQHGIEVMEKGEHHLSRGFIIEEQSVSASNSLEHLRYKDKDSLVFAAAILQSLMGKFCREDMKLKHRVFKAIFQVLHTDLNKDSNTDSKIITISKKITGKGLSSHEVFILTFLETLLRVVTEETETSPAGQWCLKILFACVEKFQASMTTEELFQNVLNLEEQRLWSPGEALNLLAALTDHHHDKGCISILKILHLMATYQVSSRWTDENNQHLLKLVNSSRTKNLIQHLEKSLRDENTKSIETLFDEIRQMKDIDEQTLNKSYSVVASVTNLIETGKIKKHKDVQRARNLSHSTDTEDLQGLLAVLCNAVHLKRAGGKWWPRATQMISWCLLALSDTGKLLEMGTGEGKSCVIAMFAVLRVLRGEKVDVVSSSSVLCQRDAEEWNNFYKFFGITADTNTNKTNDEDRKECYRKDVVYGTIEAFAADHLRQTFEIRDVRPDQKYQCIIVDEVDSLLLDQGVQLTYLSSPMVSMQHLNIILAMIWSHVSRYGFLSAGQQTFIHGPPASFFKAIFDSINTEGTEINDPIDILCIAEEFNIVPEGFTEDFYKSENDDLLKKLRSVSQDAVIHFFQELEQHIAYGFTVYTLDDEGLLCLQKRSRYNNQSVPELTFLVLEEGLCCSLYDSEEKLIKPIAEFISDKIEYTPCSTNSEGKISIPGFLKNLVEKKVSVWVQNAFLAMQLKKGREYVVENDNVCPVDFRSTGIVEFNKKWGDGLQQFVEIKHQIKLSTISAVTNYISNISLFEKYHGKIYGTTGTIGSKTDILFLQDLYPDLSTCKMPTFNRKRLFEVKGSVTTSAEEWRSEIKRVVLAQISPNSYRDGRAALVICETINKAKEIYDELKSSVPGEIILYCRSDRDSLSKIDKELFPGDVIVATNLAGRGTDIKVSNEVNRNGGLFVILSFLSENQRVELQAFGRTGRKGKPGSAQIIMSTEHLQLSFSTVSSLEEAKSTRDRLAAEKIKDMMNDVTELNLREDLFSEYLKTLYDIHQNTDDDEKRAVVAVMNDFWGIWLQNKSEDIEQLKRNDLLKSLKADLSLAKKQSQSKSSPCSSIYHYIKFGNIAMNDKKWDVSSRLFEKAMKQDESWAAIAFYNNAYCTLQLRSADYYTKAKDDLKKAQESLKYLSEESIVCLKLVKMSSANSANSDQNSLEKQLTDKCSILSYFDKNISEAIQKLDEINERGKNAVAYKSPIFSMMSGADEGLQVEAHNLYSQGLKYVFSIEEEPRFSWGALLVTCLGVLQIVAGVLLVTSTLGTFALAGVELITEGISDCIYGIHSMVKGDFSWKSWAITKAISVGVSLFSYGVGKWIAKGFKACKISVKGFGARLMAKFLSRRTTASVVAITTMRNTVKLIGKKMEFEIDTCGLGKEEEEVLEEILTSIKNVVKDGILKIVRSNMEKKPLATSVDLIILSHLEDKKQLSDLLKDKNSRSDLLAIFRMLSNTALQPFYTDVSWQNKLNSSIDRVLDRAKAEAPGTAQIFLTAIQDGQRLALARDAISVALSLSSDFFSNLKEQLNVFKKENVFSEKVKVNELSALDTEMLREFKQDTAETISALLAEALVEVFRQRLSRHAVSHVRGKVNGIIGRYARTCLNNDRTEELLRAEQNNRYITYMPVDTSSRHELAAQTGENSRSHAEKIMNPRTPGTLLDIRVLSEATGTSVVILTQDTNGRLIKLSELSPSTKPTSQTVTLIYRPQSAQYPDGHYDVQINTQTVSIVNEYRSCLFHAFARGMKPEASEREIALEARRLRFVVADTLLSHPGQWEPFVKRKVQTEAIREGDWFMLKGSARENNIEEFKEILEKKVGEIQLYKDWLEYKKNSRIGRLINADHQPPVNSLILASQMKKKSRLLKAMLEVATNSSTPNNNQIARLKQDHGLELPTVLVPYEIHMQCPSTRSPAFRARLAEAISDGDVEGTFKLTIIGSMPKFKLKSGNNVKNFQETEESRISLAVFEERFQQQSKEMVEMWFNLLQGQGVMTETHLSNIIDWINREGYNDQNDPYRDQVSKLL